MLDGVIPSFNLLLTQTTAHVQPKEMPFCLARLMTIWVLDAGGKDGMQDGKCR